MDDLLQQHSAVVYLDVFGRHVAGMEELRELLPDEVPTYRWAASNRPARAIDIGSGVWAVDRWPALEKAGAHPALNLPTVFSLDGLLYAVQTDQPVGTSIGYELVVMVAPLATKSEGEVLANHDIQPLASLRAGSAYDYLRHLRDDLVRHSPGLSFSEAARLHINLGRVTVAEVVKHGRHKGTTLLDRGDGLGRIMAVPRPAPARIVVEVSGKPLRQLLRRGGWT